MRASLLISFVVLVLVPACVAPARRTPDPQPARWPSSAELHDRAERLWKARLAEDWSTTFLYEDPTQRQQTDAEKYAEWCGQNEPFVIKAFELGAVQANPPLGWVDVKSTTSMRKFPDLPAHEGRRWEKWRVVDGQWYPVPPAERDNYPEAPAERDVAEETQLAARFAEAWRARHAKDWPAFHAFIDPRERERITVEELAQDESTFERLAADVQWVQVIGDHGQVRVRYQVKRTDPSLTKMAPEAVEILERWIKFEGAWYRQFGAKAP